MIILTEVNINSNYIGENIIISKKYKNFILYEKYYIKYICYLEYIKFKNYYIRYIYDNILKMIIYCNYSIKRHREDGPACIEYNKNGEIKSKTYCLNDKEYSYEDYLLKIKII